MTQRPRIVIAQQQRLALNSSLQASIRMLRSDTAGLTRYLEEQAADNPHLRLTPPEAPALGDWLPRWSGVLAYGTRAPAPETAANPQPSLIAHVTSAIQAMRLSRMGQRIALALVEALEPSGWIGRDVKAVADGLGVAEQEVLAILVKLQRIDPPGLFARNLAECLILQAEDLGKADDVMRVILRNLDLLAAGNMQKLAQLCGCDEAGVLARFRTIRAMNPKPGNDFSGPDPVHGREPDLIARPLKGGRWQIALNHSALPSLEVDAQPIKGGSPEALGAAKAVQHMLRARNSTLLRVGQAIANRQISALLQGRAALVPMSMADVATEVGLNISTISRVVAGATMDSPSGLWVLRRMFSTARGATEGQDNSGIAAAALRHRISRIIAAEDPAKPLSDAALAQALAEETGVSLARRTIAQYREAEGIPATPRRRRRAVGKKSVAFASGSGELPA